MSHLHQDQVCSWIDLRCLSHRTRACYPPTDAGSEYGKNQPVQSEVAQMSPNELFKTMTGKWQGTCRTWFEPGKLADESKVRGQFTEVLDGRFLRHTYEGTIKGNPRNGEETIAFNSAAKSFQTSWMDDFHMSDALMFSEGKATPRGFGVFGQYDVGEKEPKWGWKTVYEIQDDEHLIITAYNVTPQGEEAKAVETAYERIQ